MSSSWSDLSARLVAALAASAGLHAALGLALDALPWDGRGAVTRESPAAKLEVELHRMAQATPTPAAASAPKTASPAQAQPAARPASQYFLARELDVRPAPRERIDPVYPNDAFLRNVAGRVLVRLFLDETGTVEKTLILQAEPPGYFEEAVEKAFKGARFTPAMKYGRPVKAQVVLEVRYDSPLPPPAQ